MIPSAQTPHHSTFTTAPPPRGRRAWVVGLLLSGVGCTSQPAASESSTGAGSAAAGGRQTTSADAGASAAGVYSAAGAGQASGGSPVAPADAGGASGASGASGGAGVAAGSPLASTAPTGLMCELTAHPEHTAITDASPEFSWIVNAVGMNQRQTAYRILVASTPALLDANTGNVWDSAKTASAASVNVPYAGKELAAKATYSWKVQAWDAADVASGWSAAEQFTMAASLGAYSTPTPPVVKTSIAPAKIMAIDSAHYFFDFGRDAFGWPELSIDAPADGTVITVSLGEKAKGQAVDQSPGGSIRSARAQVTLQKGAHTYRVATPRDAAGFPLPAELGNVTPFRYLEVSGSPVVLSADSARQIALNYPFDDSASAFSSSSSALNQVWDLSKYSIKATTFAGIYIDGDRERTPYEADAYIQQLGHYGIDRDYALGRRSHEYLLTNPTWPTEWKFHSIMMAWADWMYTGNTESLSQKYALLKKEKTLEAYMTSDGLLNTGSLRDIVDWPEGERDGYVLADVNTVVNSFWCHALGLMAELATALGNTSDATRYQTMQKTATDALNSKLFSSKTGLYVDGLGSSHSALHANLFPLAFGLVPADRVATVVAFVKSRGMACSVYGAQYLLEALYRTAQPDAALALLTASSDRSWLNMINVGSTITLEAWDAKYKPNLDWNHAWGAAPANIVPRYLLGVRPLSAGFALAAIQPLPGSLAHIEGTVPTVRGPVRVAVNAQPLAVSVTIPANMTANLAIPPTASACRPMLDGQAAPTTVVAGVSWINGVGSGQHAVRCQ